jgi:hypothetical protein
MGATGSHVYEFIITKPAMLYRENDKLGYYLNALEGDIKCRDHIQGCQSVIVANSKFFRELYDTGIKEYCDSQRDIKCLFIRPEDKVTVCYDQKLHATTIYKNGKVLYCDDLGCCTPDILHKIGTLTKQYDDVKRVKLTQPICVINKEIFTLEQATTYMASKNIDLNKFLISKCVDNFSFVTSDDQTYECTIIKKMPTFDSKYVLQFTNTGAICCYRRRVLQH